jgi:L-lactate dehydrogenase
MFMNKRKVALVGTGMVGMSFAYSALNQNLCDEMVLIDIDRQRAEGEAMDLNHGIAFAAGRMKIYAGDYSDCSDADIVVISAGVGQKPGESRLELLQRNTEVFKAIINPIVDSGFSGIFLVATNPVDVMTRVTYELSGFNANRVFGSGTTLDTARLRYLLGEYFSVDPRSVHAYVMGEHGDSEFVPWSQAMIATKSVVDLCQCSQGKYCMDELQNISVEVRDAAQKIIEAKKATYYGIGMSLVRVVRAVLSNENSVLTVSTRLRGEYGLKDVYMGVPCVVNRNGVDRIIELSLTDEEIEKLTNCSNILKENFDGLEL